MSTRPREWDRSRSRWASFPNFNSIAVPLLAVAVIAGMFRFRDVSSQVMVPAAPRSVQSVLDRLYLDTLAMQHGIGRMTIARDVGAFDATLRAAGNELQDGERTASVLLRHDELVSAHVANLRAGQSVNVLVREDGIARPFHVDLFRIHAPRNGPQFYYHDRGLTVDGTTDVSLMARQDAAYIVAVSRPQDSVAPIAGRIAITPGYAFPVRGADESDIWSVFGDSRDGGQRVHHGIDIFAPRRTPVIAATDGTVVRVGNRRRGGDVVVLYDAVNDLIVYYAHLDSYSVERGEQVVRGQTIGAVGNTGNAVTTPPHLHLGVYAGWWSRPVDPWWYFVSE